MTLALFGLQATPTADFNLLAHIAMGVALLVGMFLARRRLFTAHMCCQAAVLLINLPLIALIMFPSFRDQVVPQVPGQLSDSYYWVATVHASLGTIAELLGLWIVLVAVLNDVDYRRSRRAQPAASGQADTPTASGSPAGFDTGRILPHRFRFRRYKPWMRTELGLWWVIVGIGIAVYAVWYQPASTSAKTGATGKHGFTISLKNFDFTPPRITIAPGTRVTWVNTQGAHTVTADSGAFDSSTLTSGAKFAFTFTRPGVYRYYCRFHGGKGGTGMSGTIVVKSRH